MLLIRNCTPFSNRKQEIGGELAAELLGMKKSGMGMGTGTQSGTFSSVIFNVPVPDSCDLSLKMANEDFRLALTSFITFKAVT